MKILINQIEDVISNYWSEKKLFSKWLEEPSAFIKILDNFLEDLKHHPKKEPLNVADQFRLCKILVEFYSVNLDNYGYLTSDKDTNQAFYSLVDLIGGNDLFQCFRALANDKIFNAYSFSMICSWPNLTLTVRNMSKEFYELVALLTKSELINEKIQNWLATLEQFEIRRLRDILTALDKLNLLDVKVFPVFDQYKLTMGRVTGDNTFYYISNILDSCLLPSQDERAKNGRLFAILVAKIQSPVMNESFRLYRLQMRKCLPLFAKRSIAGLSPFEMGHLSDRMTYLEFLNEFLCKLIKNGLLTTEKLQFLLSHPEIMLRLSYYYTYTPITNDPKGHKLFELILHFAKRLLTFEADTLQTRIRFIIDALTDTLIERIIAHPLPNEICKALSLLITITPDVTQKMLNAIINKCPLLTASIMKNLASRKMLTPTDVKIDFLTTLKPDQIQRLYHYVKSDVTNDEVGLFLKGLEREQLVETYRVFRPLQRDKQSYFSLLPTAIFFFNVNSRSIFHTTDEMNKVLSELPRARSLSF